MLCFALLALFAFDTVEPYSFNARTLHGFWTTIWICCGFHFIWLLFSLLSSLVALFCLFFGTVGHLVTHGFLGRHLNGSPFFCHFFTLLCFILILYRNTVFGAGEFTSLAPSLLFYVPLWKETKDVHRTVHYNMKTEPLLSCHRFLLQTKTNKVSIFSTHGTMCDWSRFPILRRAARGRGHC